MRCVSKAEWDQSWEFRSRAWLRTRGSRRSFLSKEGFLPLLTQLPHVGFRACGLGSRSLSRLTNSASYASDRRSCSELILMFAQAERPFGEVLEMCLAHGS